MSEDFAHAGTLIHGTLRTQDLIPAFLGKLRELSPEDAGRITRAYPYAADVAPEDREDPWGSDDMVAELADALNELAPEGWYFGTLEGDGSDYGFWREEEV